MTYAAGGRAMLRYWHPKLGCCDCGWACVRKEDGHSNKQLDAFEMPVVCAWGDGWDGVTSRKFCLHHIQRIRTAILNGRTSRSSCHPFKGRGRKFLSGNHFLQVGKWHSRQPLGGPEGPAFCDPIELNIRHVISGLTRVKGSKKAAIFSPTGNLSFL